MSLINQVINKKTVSTQLIYLSIFVLLNGIIYSLSVPKYNYYSGKNQSATFWNASDGQRYWGAALNLVEKKYFTVSVANDEPLKNAIRARKTYNPEKEKETPLIRAGPIPALLFAIPIKLVGLDKSAVWIVSIQCSLLFIAGVFARRLCQPYRASKNVIQALIIFNPNLIGICHHAQSDLVFMFIMTILLVTAGRILERPSETSIWLFLGLGILAGLLPLARPMGFYFILVLPLLICGTSVLSKSRRQVVWKKLLFGMLLSTVVACFVLTPWGLRNQEVFGEFRLTHSEGLMMDWHYRMFERNQIFESKNIEAQEYLRNYRLAAGCQIGDKCELTAVRAYAHAMWDSGVPNIFGALAASWGKLFFAGGSTQLAKYLGKGTKDFGSFFSIDKTFANQIDNFFNWAKKKQVEFFMLLVLTIIFTTVCRVLGLIGLITIVKARETWAHTLFYIGATTVFLPMYLFSSIARFRAPLEPILALFAAIGISWIFAYRRTVVDMWRVRKSHNMSE